MADPQRKWVTDDVLTYSYLLLYIALSSGQIFFNKWVLSSKEINFPYPLGLTLLHMVFSSILCFMLTKVLKIMEVEKGMTLDIYISSVIPIGAMFAMTLWLGNTAYLYISVSFAQMLKAIMPVAVFILGVAAGLEMMSCRMLLIMSVISLGVLVASYGEIDINWVGVVYQMGGVVGEALRLIFMEILVKRKGLKLNPISVMYYVSPCSALCLLVPWIFLEKPKMDEQRTWSFQPLILTLNSLCTFALNLSVFLVIQHTSALTIRVAGVVKDWVVVLLSALLFADTKLTLINLFGYAIAIAGVAAYNNHKLKKGTSQASSDESEPTVPLIQSSNSNKIALLGYCLLISGRSHGPGSSGQPIRGGSDGGGGGRRIRSLMAYLQMNWQPNLLSHKRKTGPPLGLKNLGNTCYINSVLQCLTYTPPLAYFCLKSQHSASCDSEAAAASGKKSECPFCILEKRIARSLSLESSLDTPAKINSCLKIFAQHFRFGRQEDAHEFLRYVIDACHNTCLRLKKLQQQTKKGGGGDVDGNGNTIVKEIFGGALQSQRFFQPEVLDGNNKYKCENCKKLVTARKQMSILQAPNVLVIQLKRFEGIYGGKIDKPIAFEEVLVLSSYMCKASQDLHPEYNLFGTIVHSGFSPDSGHYYAYIKDAVGRWYCCNDSHVSPKILQEVLSEKVYILFFSRTKQRSPPTKTCLSINGSKSNHSNGLAKSKILISDLAKAENEKQVLGHPSEKENVMTSKVSKVHSSPVRELGIFERSSFKRPTSGNIKMVFHSKESGNRTGDVRASVLTEKEITSLPDRNGVSKSCGNGQVTRSHALTNGNGNGKLPIVATCPVTDGPLKDYGGSNGKAAGKDSYHKEVTRSSSLANGNGKIQSVATDTLRGSLHRNNGENSESLTAITSAYRDTSNGHVESSSISGSKRKSSDQCILLEYDAQSRAKVEELKKELHQEASSFLRTCGWSEEVYAFMRSKKSGAQSNFQVSDVNAMKYVPLALQFEIV
ncbi:hypothetical protein RDI58_018786 [Solanum bulbocastanum]